MSPVFLLNVGVIVLFVWTASGKLNPSLLAIPQKMVVDKLRTIIRIYPQYSKGKPLGDSPQSFDNASLTLSHHGFCLHPT
jgi:hypothetical protein